MPYQTGFREGLFEGQTLLIPGGGGGLGRCIAHEFAALGAKLVLAGRTMEKLERTRAEISEDGGFLFSPTAVVRNTPYNGFHRDEPSQLLGR